MERSEREALLTRLQHDAHRIASHFGLRYRGIVADRAKSRYGVCYDDGLIKIRLDHAKTGRALKYSSLIDTLCHELAHLKHFDHSPAFREFFFRVLGWARSQGIYRPGPHHRHRRSPSVEPPPLPDYKPPRRNGVPVFTDAEPAAVAGQSLLLPWEQPPVESPAKPSPHPTAARPPRRPPPPRPRQLSLF